MAVIGDRVTVTNAAAVALVDGNDWDGAQGVLKNVTATVPIYLGGDSTVTSATGFQWDVADGPLAFDIKPGEMIYARLAAAAASQTVHRLATSE